MCGRYTLFKLEQILKQFPWLQLPPDLRPRPNVAPTQPILAWTAGAPDRLDYFHWGLIPAWAKDRTIGSKMINARAETLAEKPSFRTALQRRRCLIPADGFWEWRRDPGGIKTPVHFTMKSGEPFMFAGLWDRWKAPDGSHLPSCTIITTAPNALVQNVHNRMPAIIPAHRYGEWLEGGDHASLLQPFDPDAMEARDASRGDELYPC